MSRNPQATARIAGHPLHPMLVPFPVAFLVATLAATCCSGGRRKRGWSIASVHLLGAGLIIAVLAATAGLFRLSRRSGIRALTHAWHHLIGNIIVFLLSVWNWYRVSPRQRWTATST